MLPGSNGNARLLQASAIAIALMLAALPPTASAGPMALYGIVDDGASDDGEAGDPNADGDAQMELRPDEQQPSEDGTDGQPGAAAPEPPSGCLFRDGPLELVV